jgi:hypothetical protein
VVIRKVSIGPDYKNAMHYQIGQNVVGSYKILSIVHEDERILINVVNDKDEVYIWKSFTSAVPISIEHNIDF